MKALIMIASMLLNKNITQCYTLPEENNEWEYCYTETLGEYIYDYTSEIILVNYYKTIDK